MNLAVRNKGFVERIRKGTGPFVCNINVKEEPATYGQVEPVFEKCLGWKVFDGCELR